MTRARALAPVVLSLAGCARACGEPAAGADAAADAREEAGTSSALAPPRCRELEGARRVADDGVPVEVGTAAQAGTTVWVGLVRGGVAVASGVAADLSTSRAIELGPADPAGPPPVPVADGERAWVAWTTRGDAGRRAIVARLAERAERVWDVPLDAGDEDVELDLAVRDGAGLLAWTAGDAVHVVTLKKDGAVGATHDHGKGTGDVGAPRLEPRAGGFWLGWTTARPEGDAAVDAIEGAGDRASTGWVTALAIDDDGAAARAPSALGSQRGHVFAYDWRATPAGLDVVVREDVRSALGPGATLALVHVTGEAKPDVSRLVEDGVGRGEPVVLGPWLVSSDPLEHARLLPIDVPAARPSAEQGLADARPIWAGPMARTDAGGQEGRVLAVRVGERGRGAEVRGLVCVESR